jgi:glycosyltransferase involved in cell wall biosynthesis
VRPETPPSIAACFPAFNEADNLAAVIGAADQTLRAVTDVYEIIVVDDGSADQTPAVLTTLAERYPALRSIRHPQNRGYGAAVLTGLRAARMDLVFFCDADDQFDPRELPKLLALIHDADVVSGFRGIRRDPIHRRLNAFLWNRLVRLAFGVRVKDLNCAFKLFRRSALEQAGLHEVASTGATINAELWARLGKANARIREVEVSHRPRRYGQQTGASLRVILRAFQELFRLYRRLR